METAIRGWMAELDRIDEIFFQKAFCDLGSVHRKSPEMMPRIIAPLGPHSEKEIVAERVK